MSKKERKRKRSWHILNMSAIIRYFNRALNRPPWDIPSVGVLNDFVSLERGIEDTIKERLNLYIESTKPPKGKYDYEDKKE